MSSDSPKPERDSLNGSQTGPAPRQPLTWGRPQPTVFRVGPLPRGGLTPKSGQGAEVTKASAPVFSDRASAQRRAAEVGAGQTPQRMPRPSTASAGGILSGSMIPRKAQTPLASATPQQSERQPAGDGHVRATEPEIRAPNLAVASSQHAAPKPQLSPDQVARPEPAAELRPTKSAGRLNRNHLIIGVVAFVLAGGAIWLAVRNNVEPSPPLPAADVENSISTPTPTVGDEAAPEPAPEQAAVPATSSEAVGEPLVTTPPTTPRVVQNEPRQPTSDGLAAPRGNVVEAPPVASSFEALRIEPAPFHAPQVEIAPEPAGPPPTPARPAPTDPNAPIRTAPVPLD